MPVSNTINWNIEVNDKLFNLAETGKSSLLEAINIHPYLSTIIKCSPSDVNAYTGISLKNLTPFNLRIRLIPTDLNNTLPVSTGENNSLDQDLQNKIVSFCLTPASPVLIVISTGRDGKSAYQTALENGFIGTEEEWLALLTRATSFDPSSIDPNAFDKNKLEQAVSTLSVITTIQKDTGDISTLVNEALLNNTQSITEIKNNLATAMETTNANIAEAKARAEEAQQSALNTLARTEEIGQITQQVKQAAENSIKEAIAKIDETNLLANQIKQEAETAIAEAINTSRTVTNDAITTLDQAVSQKLATVQTDINNNNQQIIILNQHVDLKLKDVEDLLYETQATVNQLSTDTSDKLRIINTQISNTDEKLKTLNNTIDQEFSSVDGSISEAKANLRLLEEGLTEERQLRESGDTKVYETLDAYKLVNDDAVVAAMDKAKYAASTSEVNAEQITGLTTSLQDKASTSYVDIVKQNITQETDGKLTAQSGRITSLESTVNNPITGLTALSTAVSNTYTKSDTDSAITGKIESYQATVGDVRNYTLVAAGLPPGKVSSIYDIKNKTSRVGGSSYNVVIFSNGIISDFRTFDIFNGDTEGFIQYINNLTKDVYVAIFTSDEPSSHSADIWSTLVSLGASQTSQSQLVYRGAYLLVGCKGFPEGQALELIAADANTVLKYNLQFVNGAPIGVQGAAATLRQVKTVAAELVDYKQAVIEKDKTITKRFESAESKLAENTSNISSLQETQTTLAQATTSRFEAAESKINNNESKLSTLETTVTTSDEALGQRIDLTNAKVAENSASITDLSEAQATTTSATALKLSELSSTVEGNTSSISSLTKTTADLDRSTTQRFEQTNSRVAENESSLLNLQETVITTEQSLSRRVEETNSKVNDNTSSINSLEQTFVTEKEATNLKFTGIDSRLSNNEANLSELQQTQVTFEQATAERINKTETTLAENSSSIKNLEQSQTTLEQSTTQRFNESVSRFQANESKLSNLEQTFTSEKEATSQRFTVNESKLNNNEAAISNLEQTVVNNNESTTKRFEKAESQLESTISNLTTFQQTQATKNTALTEQLTTATSQIENVSADLTEYKQTQATVDEALSQRINNTSARLDTNEATVLDIKKSYAQKNEVAAIAQTALQNTWQQDALSITNLEGLTEHIINLYDLDINKWYPVTMSIVDVKRFKFFLYTTLDASLYPCKWSNHPSNSFSLSLKWEENPSGGGTIDVDRVINLFAYGWTKDNISPVQDINQVTTESIPCIYLRGGAKYSLYTQSQVPPEIITTSKTYTGNKVLEPSVYKESFVPKSTSNLIQANSSATQTLSNTVGLIDGKVQANAQAITNLEGQVTNPTTGLTALSTAISNTYTKSQADSAISGAVTQYKSTIGDVLNYTIQVGGLESGITSTLYDIKNKVTKTGGRSYNIVTFNSSGGISDYRSFDIFTGGTAITNFNNYVASIAINTFVVVFTFDEPLANSTSIWPALVSLGASQASQQQMINRGAYMLVGCKGFPEGQGLELIATAKTNVLKYNLQFVNGVPVGVQGAAAVLKAATNVGAELTSFKQTQATTDKAQTARLDTAESKLASNTASIQTIQQTYATKTEVGSLAQTSLQSTWQADALTLVRNEGLTAHYLDLYTLDVNTWYPVVVQATTEKQLSMYLYATLDGAVYPCQWSSHNSNSFSLDLKWTEYPYGGGARSIERTIQQFQYTWTTNDISPALRVDQLGAENRPVVWLRGGAKYTFYTQSTTPPEIVTSVRQVTGGGTIAPMSYDATLVPKSVNNLIQANASATQTLSNNVGLIDGRVTANANSITQLNSKVNDPNTGLTALSTAITNTYTKAQTDSVVAGEVSKFNATLTIGGVNRVLNTTQTVTANGAGWIFIEPLAELIKGEVTISFEVENTSTVTGSGVGFRRADGGYIYYYFPDNSTGKKTWTGTVDSTGYTHFGIYVNSACKVSKIQLEKGNKATTWSLAPEDIDAKIQTVSSSLTDYKNAQATLDKAQTDRLTSAESRLGGAEASLNTIQQTYATKTEVGSLAQTALQATWKNDALTQAKTWTSVKDTRNDNQPPSWYWTNYRQQTVQEFKSGTVIGLSGTGYVMLVTEVRWTDGSGGAIIQTVKTDQEKLWQRKSIDANTWSAWNDRVDSLDTKVSQTFESKSDARSTYGKIAQAIVGDATIDGQSLGNIAVDSIDTIITKVNNVINNRTSKTIELQSIVGKSKNFKFNIGSFGGGISTITYMSDPKVDKSFGARSYNVFTFNYSNETYTYTVRSFDIYGSTQATTDFNNYITSLAANTYVVVFSHDEPNAGKGAIWNSLVSLGATNKARDLLAAHGKYLLIGQKGLPEGGAIELIAKSDQPLEYVLQTVEGVPLGLTNSASYSTATQQLYADTKKNGDEITATSGLLTKLTSKVGYNAQADVMDNVYTKTEANSAIAGKVTEFESKLSNSGDNLWSVVNQAAIFEQGTGAKYAEVESEEKFYIRIDSFNAGGIFLFRFDNCLVDTSTQIIAGAKYTVSFDASCSSSVSAPINTVYTYIGKPGYGVSNISTGPILNSEVWTQFKLTITAQETATTGTSQLFGIALSQAKGWKVGDIISIRHLQMQQGEIATGFRPASSKMLKGIATVKQDLQTETTPDKVAAKLNTYLETKRGDKSTRITDLATSVDGVMGSKEVYIDNNGVISGYGLKSQLLNGQVVSSFGINADNFYIGNPSSGDKFFSVKTSTWQDSSGVTRPAGAYINTAFIADLSADKITSGFIKADRIQTGSLSGDKITVGSITADRIQIGSLGTDRLNSSFVNKVDTTTDKLNNLKVGSYNLLLKSNVQQCNFKNDYGFASYLIEAPLKHNTEYTLVVAAGTSSGSQQIGAWVNGYQKIGDLNLIDGGISVLTFTRDANVGAGTTIDFYNLTRTGGVCIYWATLIEGNKSSLLSWVQNPREAIQDIKVGGTNLFSYGDFSKYEHATFPSDFNNNGGNNVVIGNNYVYSVNRNYLNINGSNGNGIYVGASSWGLIAGEEVTVSFLARGNGQIAIGAEVFVTAFTSSIDWISPDAGWKKYTGTCIVNRPNGNFTIYLNGASNIDIVDIMVEKGNKATQWVPSPKEVQEKINNVQTNLTNFKNEVNDDNILTAPEKSYIYNQWLQANANYQLISRDISDLNRYGYQPYFNEVQWFIGTYISNSLGSSSKIADLTRVLNDAGSGYPTITFTGGEYVRNLFYRLFQIEAKLLTDISNRSKMVEKSNLNIDTFRDEGKYLIYSLSGCTAPVNTTFYLENIGWGNRVVQNVWWDSAPDKVYTRSWLGYWTEWTNQSYIPINVGGIASDASKLLTDWAKGNPDGKIYMEGSKIAAGTIAANQIAANAITGEKIVAKTITTDKLTVGDFTNLWPNPYFDPNGDVVGEYAGGNNSAPKGFARLLRNRDHIGSYYFPVERNEIIRIEVTAVRNIGNLPLNMGLVFKYRDGATSVSYPAAIYLNDPGYGWGRYYQEIIVPNDQNVKEATIFFQLDQSFDPAQNSTSWNIGELVIRKKLTGKLIVDGSISANHIAANSITADKIDTRRLTIKDEWGNIIFGSGTKLNTSNISGLGSLATANGVTVGQVSGLGTLATQSSVDMNTQVSNKGAFATLSQITKDNASTFIANAAIGSAHVGVLTADNLAAGSVTAGKIAVNSLSAISANLGTMVSGNPSGARTVITGDRTEVYDENNQLRVRLGRW